MKKKKQRLIVSLIHLGCPKNLVDTEKVLGQLASNDYLIAQNPEDSDIVIINTCGFIEAARDEAKATIKNILTIKENSNIHVVVIGCMVQLYKEELKNEFPNIDGIVGFSNYDKIPQYLQEIIKGKKKEFLNKKAFIPTDDLRLRVTERNFAYLRVAEGCDNNCSYCTIPLIRGKMRSKPLKQIIEEAKMLIEDGAKELIVIGQDTTQYGKDLEQKCDLYTLISKLSKLKGLKWIRIMYAHPSYFKEEFIEIFSLPKVVPYLEMPIQHINNRILNEMKRGQVSSSDIKNLIENLRKKIPNIVVRTTVMVGFPGETDSEFSELYQFIKDIKFDRLGAFMYSPEKKTKAAKLPNQVKEKQKQKRYDAIMSLQQEITFDQMKKMIGKEVEVVLEELVEKNVWRARSYAEAPEIDPCIYVETKKGKFGKFCKVRITQCDEYDYIAKF